MFVWLLRAKIIPNIEEEEEKKNKKKNEKKKLPISFVVQIFNDNGIEFNGFGFPKSI